MKKYFGGAQKTVKSKIAFELEVGKCFQTSILTIHQIFKKKIDVFFDVLTSNFFHNITKFKKT